MEYDLILVSLPTFSQKSPSLGLAALASYLKEKNYNVFCFDYGIQFYREYLHKYKITNPIVKQLDLSLYPLWGAANWINPLDVLEKKAGNNLLTSLCPVCSKLYQPIFEEFRKQSDKTRKLLDSYAEALTNLESTVYGFSLLLGNAVATLYVLKQLKRKKPEATIIVGGPDASPFYHAYFYAKFNEIDYVVYHSEGEIPLEHILAFIQHKISQASIPGIFLKINGQIKKTHPPAPLDLNSLPIHQFELVNTGYDIDEIKSLDLLTSKGCPYNCLFCNENLVWGSYRPKSPQRIFEEIKFYVETYGITHFELADNSFSSSNYLQKALQQLATENIKVKWSGNGRISEFSARKAKKYKSLGLTHCYFGIESGSPKILKLMGKNFTISDAKEILQACDQNQIETSIYLMVGFPNETRADFQETLNFIQKNTFLQNIVTSVFTLMPGTLIFDSNLLTPIQLEPKNLNIFTYKTHDGVTHQDREDRFLSLLSCWKRVKNAPL